MYAALALLVVASAYGAFRGVGLQGPARAHGAPASCRAPKVGADPVMTAMTFIHAAVERTNTQVGFALATDPLRRGTTCRDWASGKLPLKAYLKVDWKQSQYRVETRGSKQIVMQVLLTSSAAPEKPQVFVLELHQVGAQWRVGYWGPADVAV